MTVVEVVFSDGDSSNSGKKFFPLFFRPIDIPPAKKWVKLLSSAIDKRSSIESHYLKSRRVKGRFIGFPGYDKKRKDISHLINRCIDFINASSSDQIPIRASENSSQNELNELHKYFEVLRGPVLDPTELFLHGSTELKRALEDFNLLIHEYESVLASGDGGQSSGAVAQLAVTFGGDRVRELMAGDDRKYFDFHMDFGGLYLHYCEVGKTVLDVFWDNDNVVGDSNVRPLEYISAAFDVHFGQPNKQWYGLDFRTKLAGWLRDRGLDITDDRLSLGFMKVGQLIFDKRIRNLSQREIFDLLSGYMNVEEVVVHD